MRRFLPTLIAAWPGLSWAVCPPSTQTLTCSSTFAGSITYGQPNQLGGSYGCGAPFPSVYQNGPEQVLAFSCQQSGQVTLLLSNMTCDFDIFVLGDVCAPPGDCYAGASAAYTANDRVSFTCSQGQTYHILIEGYGYQGGQCAGTENFTLSFDTTNPGVGGCVEDCDDGVDNDQDGYLDCLDNDCIADPACGELCHNGADDDRDGAIDCLDSDCLSDPGCCDDDLDGYVDARHGCGGNDCDDRNVNLNPGVAEIPDGIDQDCDVYVDEGTIWYDDDGDGVAEVAGDCDDSKWQIAPGVPETCDGVDEDCDGVIDEGTRCHDDDGDGLSEQDGDCDDHSALVSPAATEVLGNGIDDDCDGTVDDHQADRDFDGFSTSGGDCDDHNGAVRPGAIETPDGVDEDCNGLVDDHTVAYDDDGDGLSEQDGDCQDGDPTIHPGAHELPNGNDDDCDGTVDEGTLAVDDDGDGLSETAGDCDDSNPLVFPGSFELPDNGLDDDCDGIEWTDDADADGVTPADGDCNDFTGWVRPGLEDLCDGLDNDCDGIVDQDCETGPIVKELPYICACSGDGRGSGAAWLVALLVPMLRRRRT